MTGSTTVVFLSIAAWVTFLRNKAPSKYANFCDTYFEAVYNSVFPGFNFGSSLIFLLATWDISEVRGIFGMMLFFRCEHRRLRSRHYCIIFLQRRRLSSLLIITTGYLESKRGDSRNCEVASTVTLPVIKPRWWVCCDASDVRPQHAQVLALEEV